MTTPVTERVPGYRSPWPGPCCCPTVHDHDWYRRTLDDEVWMECRQCGVQDEVSS